MMGFLVLLLAHQTSVVPSDDDLGSASLHLRDRDGFAAIVEALAATSEFSDVRLDPCPSAAMIGADRAPFAIVVPTRWHEDADVAAGTAIRRVQYLLLLAVRLEDPRERFDAIERLSAIALNALCGSSLGGFCFPGLSRLEGGRYDPASRHPELRVEIEGEFAYAIPSTNTRSIAR